MTHASRPLVWRAFAANSAVLTAGAVLLAVSPATVSFPIAVAEALVLIAGLATMLGLNLALLPRAVTSARSPGAVTSGPGVRRERVGPVLVCWSRPQRLTADETEQWVSAELRRVLAAERLDTARLTRLRAASARYGAPCTWLLELDVPAGRDAERCLDTGAWSVLLGDLYALGMHPGAMVVDRGDLLRAEAS
jgi:hypothetical protein